MGKHPLKIKYENFRRYYSPKMMKKEIINRILFIIWKTSLSLSVIGAFFTVFLGIFLIYIQQSFISGFDVIVFAISIVAIAMASISGSQIVALADLNFDEKMAMMTDYKNDLFVLKEKRENIENKLENLEEFTLEYVGSLLIARKNIEVYIGSILERCIYDLTAISHLRLWVKFGKRKDLLDNYIIKIIETAWMDDASNDNKRKIRELIEISLKITPYIDFFHLKWDSTYQRLKEFREKCPSIPVR